MVDTNREQAKLSTYRNTDWQTERNRQADKYTDIHIMHINICYILCISKTSKHHVLWISQLFTIMYAIIWECLNIHERHLTCKWDWATCRIEVRSLSPGSGECSIGRISDCCLLFISAQLWLQDAIVCDRRQQMDLHRNTGRQTDRQIHGRGRRTDSRTASDIIILKTAT